MRKTRHATNVKEMTGDKYRVRNTIVKIQRPMMPPNAPWLIYSEHHSIYAFMPADEVPAGVRDSVGEVGKVYWYANHRKDGVLELTTKAPVQPW